ncbi:MULTISPECIES: cyclophilin-like fold protein [unclassified Mesorhizobium]|uniref:cyclophilin-like fold protein n=1 Tax=unclassified Mesorhizobium TaxID=325217 RepID=UPI003334F1E2
MPSTKCTIIAILEEKHPARSAKLDDSWPSPNLQVGALREQREDQLPAAQAQRRGQRPVRDLCYYAPWGKLAIFYAGYHWSRD